MKTILLLSLMIFCSTITNAQDHGNINCDDYINVENDRITGNRVIGSNDINIVIDSENRDNAFGIDFWYNSSTEDVIVLNVQIRGGGNCIDRGDKMNILFRDGTRMELSNVGDFNCDPLYTQYFGSIFGMTEKLDEFGSKEIELMRIQTRNESVDVEFSEEESKQVMNVARCVVNAAR